jgi:LPS-assembly protein
MHSSRREKFGIALLPVLLISAGSASAQALPPLRINPALLGAGTPPPAATPTPASLVASPPTPPIAATQPPAPVLAQPILPPPAAAIAPAPVSPAIVTPVAAPAATAIVSGGKPARKAAPEAATVQVAAPAAIAPTTPSPVPTPITGTKPDAIAVPTKRDGLMPESGIKHTEPPQVAERPSLPPLYSAHLEAGELPQPALRGSASISPYLKQPGEELPTFISADRINGKNDVEVVAEGEVEMRKRNSILLGERLVYRQTEDEVEATGNVRLSRDGDRISGPSMKMRLDDSTGTFEQPSYSIRRIKTGSAATLWTGSEERESSALTTGTGAAARLEFEGEGRYRLQDATYSTCAPVAGRDPDWFARTADLRLDYDTEQGTARDATLYFKGAPILYSPWLSFSLNNERKSGLLTPTAGSTSQGGAEFTQPFYWNIAPNMDATIAPRIMSKRGTMWKGEYRYLQPSYAGTVDVHYLPKDKVLQRYRGSYSVNHSQSLGYGFSGALALNGASDDTYFSDLANGSSMIAQTNLLRQGTLSYSGGWWSANVLAQSYQTLQDPSLPRVVEPYRRLPQVTVDANRYDLPLGLNFGFRGEHVNFRNPALVEGRRVTLYPQLSWPLQTEVISITPKIGFHSTRYSLERQAAGVPDKLTRNVPIFSLDSSVTFERELNWFGAALTQTLEPRLYYLYVPERDQRLIPVFDTAVNDFNFAQIFGENRYGGGDRIGDANQATAMLTSRLIDPQSGAESLRVAFGQRFYFSTQKVGLPGEVLRSDRQTDFLASLSGRVLPKTYGDVGVQYNPRLNRMERLNVGGRYQPESGKVLSAGYRYSRDQLGQVDISGQWPMFGGWHAVGRFNYSTKDRRMIESVAGLEFDGGCWVGRIVMQRLATLTQQSNTALFFQLELNGFAKVGSNPLDILKRSVPGYGLINQQGDESQGVAQ